MTGNPDLCASGKSCQTTPTFTSGTPAVGTSGGGKKKKSSKLPVILGVTIPVFVLIWAVVGVLAILHHKRKTAAVAALTAGENLCNHKRKTSAVAILHHYNFPLISLCFVHDVDQNGGANRPNGASINPQMIGKIGMAVMDEFKVNVNDQGTSSENTSNNQTAQQA